MAKSEKKNSEGQSFWRAVFNQSRVNGAAYRGDYLPAHSWIWPRGTFLQRRLRAVRAQESADASNVTPAREELAAAIERVERPASTRLRLVNEPRAGAAERDDNGGDLSRELLASRASRAEPSRPSPTQALLGLEREGWARLKDGAVQPVQIDEKSVQAALHKENIEKFQQTLVQSGEWVRSQAGEAAPEPPSTDQPEPVVVTSSVSGPAAIPADLVAAAPVEVQATPAIGEPIATAVAGKPAFHETLRQNAELRAKPQASREESRPAVQSQPINAATPQLSGWDDIDEKLFWLATPSK